MKSWEIERLFKDDIRDKKKTGSGAFHMRGKGVRHGSNKALRTPYHFMKTKEKRLLDGEVEVFNMYETIIPWNEFSLKSEEQQKNLLTRWRELYPNQKIMDELGEGKTKKFNTQSFADLVNGLGCPAKQKGGSLPRQYKKRETKPAAGPKEAELKMKNRQTSIAIQSQLELEPEQKEPVKLITNGLHLEYNGEYDSEALNKIFTKLQLLIDGEDNKFVLSINLTERIS